MDAVADETTFKHYLSFFSGQQFSLLGSSIVQFVIVWWITLETGSTLYLSLAAFAGYAPMVIIVPFAGVLVDRLNRKTVIAVADFFQALSAVILITFFWLSWASVYIVLGLLAIRGVCQAFHVPAVSAIVPSMVPKDKLSRINGLEYLLHGAVTLSGPVIAAILLVFARIDQILWIDPLTFAIAVTVLLLIKIPSVKESQEKSSFKKEFMEGLTFVKSTRGLLPLVLLATALNFLIMPIATLLPYYVRFDHFGEAGDLAFVEAFIQGGFLAGGTLMAVKKGFKRGVVVFVVSILISLGGYAVISFTPLGFFWFMAVVGLIHGLPVPIANVSVRTIIQTVAPLNIQGRVNSMIISLASLAVPIGMILSGALAKYVGTANLFLGCALIGILITAPSWFFTDIRHLENLQENVASQVESLSDSDTSQK